MIQESCSSFWSSAAPARFPREIIYKYVDTGGIYLFRGSGGDPRGGYRDAGEGGAGDVGDHGG
jgi:hypothetical protein